MAILIKKYLLSSKKLSLRLDRKFSYELIRYHHQSGETFFGILSSFDQTELILSQSGFDQVRMLLSRIQRKPAQLGKEGVTLQSTSHSQQNQHANYGLDRIVRRNINDMDCIILLQDQAQSQITIPAVGLTAFIKLCYDDVFEQPQDILDRIINYHRLFQLTFTEGSQSIKSDLKFRTDFLLDDRDFSPKPIINHDMQIVSLQDKSSGRPDISGRDKAKAKASFKPKLGERQIKVDYAVNYEKLREASPQDLGSNPIQQKSDKESVKNFSYRVPVALHVNEFKQGFSSTKQSEHSSDELAFIRDHFLGDRNATFYVGFECCEAIYRSHGKLKSVAFPLYYSRVAIRESNRSLYLDPLDHGRIFLNHIALAYIVDRFSPESEKSAALQNFLTNLSSQEFEVGAVQNRIHISRQLPVDDSYFRTVRSILFGEPGEQGKGGLFSNMNIVGFEIDTENVFLYKNQTHYDIATLAISEDLDLIMNKATFQAEKFRSSLLSSFLSGHLEEEDPVAVSRKDFFTSGYCSSQLGQVFRNSQSSPITVIEGPPGTGKSFTILNILIDAICRGRRTLVVSDKPGAIEAIREKIEGYLLEATKIDDDDKQPLALISREVLYHLLNGSLLLNTSIAGSPDLVHFANQLLDQIPENDLDFMRDLLKERNQLLRQIQEMNQHIEDHRLLVKKIISTRREQTSHNFHAAASLQGIPSTDQEITELCDLLGFLEQGMNFSSSDGQKVQLRGWQLIHEMIEDRIHLVQAGIFPLLTDPSFSCDIKDTASQLRNLVQVRTFLNHLIEAQVSKRQQLIAIAAAYDSQVIPALSQYLLKNIHFPQGSGFGKVLWRLKNPLKEMIQDLMNLVDRQIRLTYILEKSPVSIKSQLQTVHDALQPGFRGAFPLALDLVYDKIIHHTGGGSLGHPSIPMPEIAKVLSKAKKAQLRKDQLIRELTLSTLAERCMRNASQQEGSTSIFTRIRFLLEQIKEQSNYNSAKLLLDDLKQNLMKAYPVLICQKQVVSLLAPCSELIFDLAIVDEATQCRVDDSLPILYRSKRFMVVGDDKQTVLAKHSELDDYLFSQYDLDKRLLETQSSAIKGGGSHVFMLAKNIKQSSITLVEHYRCPPAIIDYSNRYVYDGKLRIMQWERASQRPSVVINDSEIKHQGKDQRNQSGKYKGIETAMITRFLDYIMEEVKQIEKETGKRLNFATDVAICTFLIKNRVFFDDIKPEFLAKAKRGDDLLIGAGAELQGKERDYIFYFWDAYPGNMLAFRQGDDSDKRKGELNVLMSRPKIRAYHFLHRDFYKIRPGSASIIDYLRSHLEENKEREGKKKKAFIPRKLEPNEKHPLNRGSGQLMFHILERKLQDKLRRRSMALSDLADFQYSVQIGSPKDKVDLIISPKYGSPNEVKALAIIDLAKFQDRSRNADELIDYAFQLERAYPAIQPIFAYIHELVNEQSYVHYRLMRYLDELFNLKRIEEKGANRTRIS